MVERDLRRIGNRTGRNAELYPARLPLGQGGNKLADEVSDWESNLVIVGMTEPYKPVLVVYLSDLFLA